MYNNIDSAAKGISDYTSRVDRLKTIVSFKTDYMFPDAKSSFSLDLKPAMDKYYTFEIISDPRAKFSPNDHHVDPWDHRHDRFL